MTRASTFGAILGLRTDLRGKGDYDGADAVRDGLTAIGVEVRDTPAGPEWVLHR